MLCYQVHPNFGSLSFWITNPIVIIQCSSLSQRQRVFSSPQLHCGVSVGCLLLLPQLLFCGGDAGEESRQNFNPFWQWLPFPSPSLSPGDTFPCLLPVLPQVPSRSVQKGLHDLPSYPWLPGFSSLPCRNVPPASEFSSGFSRLFLSRACLAALALEKEGAHILFHLSSFGLLSSSWFDG